MEVGFELSTKRGVIRGNASLPAGGPSACLILCHGLTGNCHAPWLIRIARELEAHGIACIRFDCLGSGESDSESSQATTLSEVEDALSVFEYVRSLPQIDPSRIALGGHSLGVLVALLAAQKCEAKALVLLSSALSCYHELIQPLTGERLRSFRETGILDLGGFEVSRAMVEELSDFDGYQVACALGLPTLLIHGELDDESPVYHSIRLKEKLGDLAELNIIPGVHHCFETAAAQASIALLAAEFMSKFKS